MYCLHCRSATEISERWTIHGLHLYCSHSLVDFLLLSSLLVLSLRFQNVYNTSKEKMNLNKARLFNVRQGEHGCVCGCVCLGTGHGHQPWCHPTSLLLRLRFMRLTSFGENCCRQYSSLMYALHITQTTTQRGRIILYILCLELALAAIRDDYMKFVRTYNFQLPQNRLTCLYCRQIKLFKPSECMPGNIEA